MSALGIHPAPGAGIYSDAEGEQHVTLLTVEEEAIQFLLDGLGVESIAELHRLVERGRGFVLVQINAERRHERDDKIPYVPQPVKTFILESDRDRERVTVVSTEVTRQAIAARPG